MSNEVDELAAAIEESYDLNEGMATFELLAHAILAAGYRRRRTITTAEELDALAVGSVIALKDGGEIVNLALRTSQERWGLAGQATPMETEKLHRAAIERDGYTITTLHEGSQP